jgi:NTP pyrophosphatase (non-canonical NTP hydrolase)
MEAILPIMTALGHFLVVSGVLLLVFFVLVAFSALRDKLEEPPPFAGHSSTGTPTAPRPGRKDVPAPDPLAPLDTFAAFEAEVGRLAVRENGQLMEIEHAIIGLCEEAGEVAGLVKKGLYYDVKIDPEKFEEECGDVLNYLTVLCRHNGSSLQAVAEANRAKLRKRFPNGFTKGGGIRG